MIHFRETKSFTFLCCCFLTLIPSRVLGDCTCQPEDEDRDNSLALKYKIAAIASILVAGAIGVCFPPLGETVNALRPEKNLFFFIKAFAVGVILSTGFIHVLPDATENLTSPCLHENLWGKFPFAGLVAMAASIGTVMIDVFATPHYTKSHLHKSQQNIGGDEEKTEENENHLPVHTHATHGHAHGSVSMVQRSDSVQLLRHRVVSQVLELGIVVHSVIIGISLGASESPKTKAIGGCTHLSSVL